MSAARSVILSFIDYVDNGVSPRCPTIRRNHIFGLVIRRHLLAYCHDAGGSLLSSSPRTVISLFLSVVDDVDNTRGWRTTHGESAKAARRGATERPRTKPPRAMEDAPVKSQAEGSTRVFWFDCRCVLGLTSPENNRTCGGIEGGTANVGGYIR